MSDTQRLLRIVLVLEHLHRAPLIKNTFKMSSKLHELIQLETNPVRADIAKHWYPHLCFALRDMRSFMSRINFPSANHVARTETILSKHGYTSPPTPEPSQPEQEALNLLRILLVLQKARKALRNIRDHNLKKDSEFKLRFKDVVKMKMNVQFSEKECDLLQIPFEEQEQTRRTRSLIQQSPFSSQLSRAVADLSRYLKRKRLPSSGIVKQSLIMWKDDKFYCFKRDAISMRTRQRLNCDNSFDHTDCEDFE